MKNTIRVRLAAVLTAIVLCFTVLPMSAAAHAQETTAVRQTQTAASQRLFSTNLLPDAIGKKRVTAITRLTDEQVEEISGRIAQNADVYLVELRDGRRTYYMTVDLRTDDAVYLSKLVVMRETSYKLYARSEEMASQLEDEPEPILMSYPHIIGELSLHYLGYRITDALGGEKLPGRLGVLYQKCAVADLNIDEGRLAAAIRLAGQLFG